MQAALLADRGIVKVAGDDGRRFLNGLLTIDVAGMTPAASRFTALLTPQGKIIVDFIVAEAASEDGGGFFLDCPRALAATLVERLGFYKLRAKVAVENLSDRLGLLALWNGAAHLHSDYGLIFEDPRLAALGHRIILPPEDAADAAAELGAVLSPPESYDVHRISLGVPKGGSDFAYGDTFPHEANMDQLGGVDFDKGCYVGQEVVSRVEHRGTARSRVIPIVYDDYAPSSGLPVMAGQKQVGTLGSAAQGRGLALLRLDRVEDAVASGTPLTAGNIAIRPVKPDWARFAFPGDTTPAPIKT
jgi:folate-binding protein YgfZ